MVGVMLIVGMILTAVAPHGSAHAAPDRPGTAGVAEPHDHGGHTGTAGCEGDACEHDSAPAGCVAVSSHCVSLLPTVEVPMLSPVPRAQRRAVGDGATFVARMPETETPPPRV